MPDRSPVAPEPALNELLVQTPLFRSAGICFQLAFCKGCPRTHWGITAAISRPGEAYCPIRFADDRRLDKTQTVQLGTSESSTGSGVVFFSLLDELRDDPGLGFEPEVLPVEYQLAIRSIEPAIVFEGHSEPALQNKKYQVIFVNVSLPNPADDGPSRLSLAFGIADRCRRAGMGDMIGVRELKRLTAAYSDADIQLLGACASVDNGDVPLMILSRNST